MSKKTVKKKAAPKGKLFSFPTLGKAVYAKDLEEAQKKVGILKPSKSEKTKDSE